jgi:hypothetical protein
MADFDTEDPTGLRYYGSDMTIHDNESLDVEVDEHGQVVAVWFRCQPLPFVQSRAGKERSSSMRDMYLNGDVPWVDAVVLRDQV